MESLILAAIAGVVMWFAIQQGRKRGARRAAQARARPRPSDPGGMPRIGKPGTITAEQIKTLEANRFEPSDDWSTEEARLVLDALAYARAVLAATTGRREHDIEVQNQVYAFVLRDDAIREYVRTERPVAPLPRNEYYEQVTAFVRRTTR